jgi:alpha-methylacyl-CoA racemase
MSAIANGLIWRFANSNPFGGYPFFTAYHGCATVQGAFVTLPRAVGVRKINRAAFAWHELEPQTGEDGFATGFHIVEVHDEGGNPLTARAHMDFAANICREIIMVRIITAAMHIMQYLQAFTVVNTAVGQSGDTFFNPADEFIFTAVKPCAIADALLMFHPVTCSIIDDGGLLQFDGRFAYQPIAFIGTQKVVEESHFRVGAVKGDGAVLVAAIDDIAVQGQPWFQDIGFWCLDYLLNTEIGDISRVACADHGFDHVLAVTAAGQICIDPIDPLLVKFHISPHHYSLLGLIAATMRQLQSLEAPATISSAGVNMPGPLQGIKIIEIAGIGPGPFAAMMLADQGADVIRIDRVSGRTGGLEGQPEFDVLNRSRRSLAVDLKSPEGVALVLQLIRCADGLIEGFRPGVMERLGLGPDVCLAANPKLIYGRMTGWGQDGPMAKQAGHDINYIALAGALHAFGRAGQAPTPPINIVGDFGGGGMLMAFGMVCALLEAQKSGKGQVIDTAMVDGSALLMSMMWGMRAMGLWRDERGVNVLDTGAFYYDAYETSDGKYVSVGPIEPQFYAEFLKRVGLVDDPDFATHLAPANWPLQKAKLAAHLKTKTRDEWSALFDGSDACVVPVLSMSEAPDHPHLKARGTFVTVAGILQPAPAPRYSRTSNDMPCKPARPGENSDAVLAEFGFSPARIEALRATQVIR